MRSYFVSYLNILQGITKTMQQAYTYNSNHGIVTKANALGERGGPV